MNKKRNETTVADITLSAIGIVPVWGRSQMKDHTP